MKCPTINIRADMAGTDVCNGASCWSLHYTVCGIFLLSPQVISIGGNDARIRFLQSRNPDVITELMVTDGLVANLKRVVEIIRSEVTPNIILIYV